MKPTKTEPGRGPQVSPGAERRRSQRVMIRIPVTLQYSVANQGVTVRAHTVSVNDHGALLVCPRRIEAGMSLELQNEHTRQRVAGRTTRSPQETAEGFLVPVEFESRKESFWNISFPPPNWKPVED